MHDPVHAPLVLSDGRADTTARGDEIKFKFLGQPKLVSRRVSSSKWQATTAQVLLLLPAHHIKYLIQMEVAAAV